MLRIPPETIDIESGSGGRSPDFRREESPSRAGQRWWLTTTGGNPRESATEKTRPMAPISYRGTGKGEMVRQERTAGLVTIPAGQTPPPARPSSRYDSARAEATLVAGPAGRSHPESSGEPVGNDRSRQMIAARPKGREQNSAYRPTLYVGCLLVVDKPLPTATKSCICG